MPSDGGLPDVSVMAVAIDPLDSAKMLAGGVGGLFRSTDCGNQWLAVNDPDNPGTDGGIHDIAYNPQSPSTVFASGYRNNPRLHFILRSNDGGISWEAVYTGTLYPEGPIIPTIAIDPITPERIYAGVGGSVYQSMDSGETHEFFPIFFSAFPSIQSIRVHPTQTKRVYAGGSDANETFPLRESLDLGETWRVIAGPPDANNGVTTIFIPNDGQDNIYVAIRRDGIYRLNLNYRASAVSRDSWSQYDSTYTHRQLRRAPSKIHPQQGEPQK